MQDRKEFSSTSGLSADQRELLNALLAEEGIELAQPQAVAPRAAMGDVPLSFAQQRLWFLHQLDPETAVYNLPIAARFEGQLNIAALEMTLNEIVCRHESLRTNFRLVEGRPVQVIQPALSLSLTVVDLCELPAGERGREAQSLASAEAQRPFDLAVDPLLRATLLRLGAAEHVVLLTMHHIVSDAWSRGVLIREVATLYESFSNARPSPLPALPLQYSDYAIWQREWLQGEVLTSQLAYWQRQLAGVPMLALPTDHPRPALQSFRGAVYFFNIPGELSEALKELSRSEGATLFMTLMAAFTALLYRYTRQTDVVVGTPIAGRNRVEIEGLIGFFINTLALRTDLSGDPSFRELLQREREVTLDAYAHQDIPFEKLVEELQPERNLSHTPLFQVVFTYQNAPRETLELTGLRLSSQPRESQVAKFDLTLTLEETARGLVGSMEYNTDLFEAETIERMARHFKTLLQGAVADLDQTISTLPLLTPAERTHLLGTRLEGVQDFSSQASLHELFEAQVARTPEAVALVYEDGRLTYQELNRRANQTAHHLRGLGVGADVLVGVMLERTVEMVVALLGVLKAGGAYVPLDPEYPAERLSFMLEDAAIGVLLTQQHLLERLPAPGVPVRCLDRDWSLFAAEPHDNPVPCALAEHLAYVIYTSGSTGQPKGVMVSHANVTRLFAATADWFNFGAQDVWTLFHSYAFDFSVWELWGSLLYGGKLVIVPYWVSRAPEAFYELLVREHVTVLNQTPSAFRQLMRAEEAGLNGAAELSEPTTAGNLSMRLIIFGGEALELASLRAWYERHDEQQPQLVNMYGITETTVHVTYRPLRASDLETNTGSVIGAPLPDLHLCVLDEHLQPLPIGVAGEMYVGGAGLARGYLDGAELSAERFIPHPYSNTPGARLYRTGDLARYTTSGELEYLGRLDEQVKIRGFRIELGEIEVALDSHPLVRQSIVLAKADEHKEKRLVAYVVGNGEDTVTTSDLRNYLKQKLPEHMVPAVFVVLEQLPLTAHGKIDRRALPEPEHERPELAENFVAPRTLIEEILAAIWSEVLGVEQVGIFDNFFELGGDSIRSVRILALAKDKGLEFSLQQLFRYQTISDLAREVQMAVAGADVPTRSEPFGLVAAVDLPKLPPQLDDAYPLTMLQAGMLYHMELMPESSVYHNVNSWHLRARFCAETLNAATQEIVARHPVLRTSFDLTTFSEPLQLVHRMATLALNVHDIRHLSPAAQDELLNAFVESERNNRFELSQPPLLRFHVHQRTDDSFQFSLTECHAILDGWSLNATLAEIFSHYFMLLNQATPPLESPPAATFRDFVMLERLAIESADGQRFWDEKLSGSTVMRIPRWPKSNSQRPAKRFSRIRPQITPELSKELRQVARSAQVPLKSVLLAAHMKVLSVISGQQDVMGGVVSNSRSEELDGERVRGLFLNTLPFRLSVTAGAWADLIGATFVAEWELLPFRRYPLFALQKKRGGQPLFETAFNYVHFHTLDGVLGSGDVEVLALDSKGVEEIDYTLDAAFSLNPLTQQIHLNFQFDAWALHETQAEAIVGYYLRTLQAIADDPGARHDQQSLLSHEERKRLLTEWNSTTREYDLTRCIHELFEAQAERQPEAVAVAFEAVKLSYDELNRRANQVAHHLQGLGVGSEVSVGILLERSVEMVIALLGVLKAGGTYVPLDPSYPQERLSYMLRDSGVSVLLSQERFLQAVPESNAQVVCFDAAAELLASERDDNPGRRVLPHNLAYVIYTSGSTGQPKGVMVSHRNLVHSTCARRSYYEQPVLAFLVVSPFAFDSSVAGLFWTLVDGGTLELPNQNFQQDLSGFIDSIAVNQVSHLLCLPSLYALLCEQAVPGQLDSLRAIIVAGEPCPAALVKRHYEMLPDVELFNEYGPTEGTVWSSVYNCKREGEGTSIPIGRAIANTQIYVLDRHRQPAPISVPGEVYISGDGVARGYLNRPELTAEKFVPNPYSDLPGARLYRSGDLARYLPHGELEFLGRVDQQVKVRGYRIELGEIETVLAAHPDVRECVVVVRPDATGDRRLAAYVVAHPESQPTVSDLRQHMMQKLPEYMSPNSWVLLDALPLTANGKVDRKALPEPEHVRPKLAPVYVAPQTDTERKVAEIWQRVLQIENAGINDNFFDLGGHSLLLVKVHNELRAAFPREIQLVELLQYPTISSVADYLSQEQGEQSDLRESHERTETRKRLARQQRMKRRVNAKGVG